METLLLGTDAVTEHGKLSEIVEAVEEAFAGHARGTTQMPAKSYIDLPVYNGDFRSMPAYLATDHWDAAGVKWVNVHPDNPTDHGLPTVMGTMIYSDPETARPLAIMDGMELTRKRTGAAAAVATAYLSVDDARSLGIIGAGAQAYTQLDAIAEVRPIETVVIVDRDEDKLSAFVAAFEDRFEIRRGTIKNAASCDVLSTVTPVEDPIVPRAAVGTHTHINAIGADAAGKHELDDQILLDAKLVIDNYDQCIHSGEINVPWTNGILNDADLHGELGEVVIGDLPGRTPEDCITVFDSTGLAIQDVAAAHVVYERAVEHDAGTRIELLDVG